MNRLCWLLLGVAAVIVVGVVVDTGGSEERNLMPLYLVAVAFAVAGVLVSTRGARASAEARRSGAG